MSRANQDLTQGSISGHLFRMTLPMFLGISSMIMASMFDAIYIGIVGARELAAYSFTFPLMMGLSSVSMGIGSGAASLIARAQGAGDRAQVQRFASHSLLLTIVFVVSLMTLAYFNIEAIFTLMGAQPEVLPLVVAYMSIWVMGLPLFALSMVSSTVLRAVGNARVPGIVMTLMSGVQMILAPLLIFGLLGFPELGFLGSAWALVIIGLARTFAMFAIIIFSEKLMRFHAGMLDGFMTSTRAVMKIGLPSMLNSLIGPVSMAVTIKLLAGHGPEVVAGFGVTSRIEMLLLMVLMSLSSSVGPFVGQNWGAKKVARVYQGLRSAYQFCLVWGVFCFVLLAPFGGKLVALINDDPVLVESASWYLILVPISYGMMGIGMMSGSLFIALGKPIPTTVLALFRMVIIYLPLALLFNHFWGYIGIFLATTLANTIVGSVAYVWSRTMLAKAVAKRRLTTN